MRRIFFLFLLATLSFGRTDVNNVHPGLKSAIDRGDIQTAVNLRAAGAPGIYCPAELSPGDAVRLYRDELRNDPKQIIDNCSPEFTEKISAKSCTNPNNIKLCKSILMKTKVTKWQPMLDKIIENEVYKSKPFFEEEMDYGFKTIEAWFDKSPLNWSKKMQNLIESMKLIAKIDETNQKKAERQDYGFRSSRSEEKPSISSHCYANLTCSADKVLEKYLKDPNLDYKTMVLFCRLHPDIDKVIQKSKGLNIFDCSHVLNEYTEQCTEDRFVEKMAKLNSNDKITYRCHDRLWTKADKRDIDIGINDCSSQNRGSFIDGSVDNKNKYVCSKSGWRLFSKKVGSLEVMATNENKGGSLKEYDVYMSYETTPKMKKEIAEYMENEYGHLYSFNEARNACPEGWRLPSQQDLAVIANEVSQNVEAFPKVEAPPFVEHIDLRRGADDIYWGEYTGGGSFYYRIRNKINLDEDRGWVTYEPFQAFSLKDFYSKVNVRCVRDTSTTAFLAASKKRKATPRVAEESLNYDDESDLSERKKHQRNRSKRSNRDDDETEKKRKKGGKGDFFADDLHVGMHLGIGYAGVWGSELAHGIYLTNGTLEEGDKDPYAGTFGMMGDIGIVINYHLGSLFSIVPEVNVRIINYSKESEIWKLRVIDEYGNFKEIAPLDENMMIVDVNVPLILRITPTPSFFIDLGADLNMNVSSKYTLSNNDYDYEEDIGGYWATEQFKWGGIFGLGTTLSISESLYLDVGGRLVVDMSRIEKNQLVDMVALNGTYRNPVGAKTWGVEFVINGYMF